MQIYDDATKHFTFFNVTKYQTLKYCANESYVGANNTNTKVKIDYNDDGVIDYDGVYTTCYSKLMNISDSKKYKVATAILYSDERTADATHIFDYRVSGFCADNYSDWDEEGIDNENATSGWSKICYGDCYDSVKNGNEINVDYGGRCGQCVNATSKDDDLEYLLLLDSQYIQIYPFNESLCIEFKAVSGTLEFIIILIMGVIFLFIIGIILFVFLPMFSFIFGWKRIFNILFKKEDKKK